MERAGQEQIVDTIVVGLGLAGAAVVWNQLWRGFSVKVIDAGEKDTASRVSAGLITPYTGRRIALMDHFEEYRETAKIHYEKVGEALGTKILEERASVRWFKDEQEKADFRVRMATSGEQFQEIEDAAGKRSGFIQHRACRLKVSEYLTGTQRYLEAREAIICDRLSLAEDVEIVDGGVVIQRLGLGGKAIVFCQGYQGSGNPWFPNVPNAAAKGETLTIAVDSKEPWSEQHGSHWLIEDQMPEPSVSGPSEDRRRYRYVVGATYDRKDIHSGPTDEGRRELTAAVEQITRQKFEIVDHKAGIRAATSDRRHIVAQHKRYTQLYIVNGMGSRGALLAPVAANELMQVMESKEFTSTQSLRINLTELAQKIVRRALKKGDTAIDATAGNGHDTCFLAQLTGETGRVIGIDIQCTAIESTRSRLIEAGISSGYKLLEAPHEVALREMSDLTDSVSAIMFNLGYQPGGNKSVTTKSDSTVTAVQLSLGLLRAGGVMTVVAYRGHEGGKEEADSVDHLGKSLSPEKYRIEMIESDPENSRSPVMTVFRRLVE